MSPISSVRDPADLYWDRKLETQSRQQWDEMKLSLLRRHLEQTYGGSAYYHSSFDAVSASPEKLKSLSDIERFPIINKKILRDRQNAAPILGDLTAVPEDEIVYVSASSGSTGVPTFSPFTARDFDAWIDYEARQFWSSGLRPSDRYCHALSMSLFIGGPCVLGAQKLGALSVHAGTLPSERLLHLLAHCRITALWTTPSYAWHLGEVAQKSGIDPKHDLAVRRIFVAGEPGGSIPETRDRIEEIWGAAVYDYYGLSDIFGSCAGMCEQRNGMHWAEDHILVEVLDTVTRQPVAEGERGEMVLTTLQKQARPLIRFATGDIVSFTHEPCQCGRTSQRLLGVHGRLDDMLIIKGVNIFPSDIEAVIRGERNWSGEYRILVDRQQHLDVLTIEAELAEGVNISPDDLARTTERQIKSVTGVGAEIVPLVPNSLPRETHKAKRIHDRRGQIWTS